MSVEPMPVPKALTPPYVQEWESAPGIIMPGRMKPRSRRTWWQIPSPSSIRMAPISRANSRVVCCIAAIASLGAGVAWSTEKATRPGSKSRAAPISRNTWAVSGVLESTPPSAKSTAATTRSPARASVPLVRLRIFSIMVLPIGSTSAQAWAADRGALAGRGWLTGCSGGSGTALHTVCGRTCQGGPPERFPEVTAGRP